MEVRYVLINFVETVALNAVDGTYANTVETRTGVYHVMAQMYVNMTRFGHNASHARAISSALIRNAGASVGSVRASISALTKNRGMSV